MENLIYALIIVLSNGLFFNIDGTPTTKETKPNIEVNGTYNDAPDSGGDNDDDEAIKPTKG